MGHPVSVNRLGDELSGLLVQGQRDPRNFTMVFLDRLDDEHRRNPRRYAQVDLSKNTFEFSRAILWLPVEQRMGVLAHEVGHVLVPGGSEEQADLAAARYLGIAIRYDRRWPGKGLQMAMLTGP